MYLIKLWKKHLDFGYIDVTNKKTTENENIGTQRQRNPYD